LFHGVFPEWVPFWGGEDFMFFRPVFNVADAAISVGIGLIFIFQKRFFKPQTTQVEPEATEVE
jgi:signal peptidase II